MLELFILWKLTQLNDKFDDSDANDGVFWLVVGSLVVTWPILVYNIMRRRGDSRYMSASVAVGLASISLAFGIGIYLLGGLFGFAYVAYLMVRQEEEDSL